MKAEVVDIPQGLSAVSFRAYLKSEFARRCSANAQYSLRSFAMQLETDHSTLSQLLRGKRPLTEKMIRKLSERLPLSRNEVDGFVNYESLLTSEPAGELIEIRQLVQDTLSLISNSYHLNILELVHQDEFRPDSRWIARLLDITVDEVNVAVSRLVRLGLLEMSSVDRWSDKFGAREEDLCSFVAAAIRNLSEHVRECAPDSRKRSIHCLKRSATLTEVKEGKWVNRLFSGKY